MTLLLVLLSAGTCVFSAAEAVRGVPSGNAGFWASVVAAGAVAARLWPWWSAELRAMTRERARQYAGSALIVFVALEVTWHFVTADLGMAGAFLLLGPASGAAGFPVLAAIVVIALVLLSGLPLGGWARTGWTRVRSETSAMRERRVVQSVDVDEIPLEPPALSVDDSLPDPVPAASAPALPEEPRPLPIFDNGQTLPPIDIFAPAPKGAATPADLDLKAQRIQETLASFNVAARVVGHHHGPVVTQFDIQPERGVKVRRITELSNDLALALAAPTIRIQAPVPGKPVVGIEIPNASASVVALRELLESERYRGLASPLRVGLGKDVAGKPYVIDLARMPHLLIAGATGSGKSVCVNTIISCLLYNNTPQDVRLLMVDPKMVELTVFNGVPHLLSPVVTQTDKVVGVLQWALREMERRYKLFADTGVRNIGRYNEKLPDRTKRLPWIVLIIDELADLMMVAPDEVEDAICRLAQLARAAGIHLVIATQRPSVDVVTGLIKANFPARIAFAMTSQVDSRTILDRAGAEKLLGRGDMLYQPPDGPAPLRLQGAFLSDAEIERLVQFWHESPLHAAVERVADEEFEAAEAEAGNERDELFQQAVDVVREHQHASVSLLQRKLRIGYSRAARLMDQLELHGVVGAADGSKHRTVLSSDDSQ
ncbi:MAG TPA: DNA translocase FtsK [Chloroflexota bacterium]|nr:DNA translocase FtsK [Chloroflexota bacterium]